MVRLLPEARGRNRAFWFLLAFTIVLGVVLAYLLTQARSRATLERAKSALLEKKAAAVLDTAPAAIIVCDENRDVTFFNNAAEDLFGYTHEEMTGLKVTRLIALPEELAKHRESFDKTVTRMKSHPGPWEVVSGVDATAQNKQGETFKVHITVRCVKYNGEVECIAVVVPFARPPRQSRPLVPTHIAGR